MLPSRSRTALALTLALALLAVSPCDALVRGVRASRDSSPSCSVTSHSRTLRSSRSAARGASRPRDSQDKITRDLGAVSKVKRTHPQLPACLQGEVDNGVPCALLSTTVIGERTYP
jgi:hypothetical protein